MRRFFDKSAPETSPPRASAAVSPVKEKMVGLPRVKPKERVDPRVSLYKMLFHFKALLWESIILLLPLPPASPTRLQYYCNTNLQDSTPFRPPAFTPCTIQYCALQYRVKVNPRGLRVNPKNGGVTPG